MSGGAGSAGGYSAELIRRQLIGESCASFSPRASFARERARSRARARAPPPPLRARTTLSRSASRAAEMTKSPPEGISVGPKDDNLFVWEVLLVGPPGTMM